MTAPGADAETRERIAWAIHGKTCSCQGGAPCDYPDVEHYEAADAVVAALDPPAPPPSAETPGTCWCGHRCGYMDHQCTRPSAETAESRRDYACPRCGVIERVHVCRPTAETEMAGRDFDIDNQAWPSAEVPPPCPSCGLLATYDAASQGVTTAHPCGHIVSLADFACPVYDLATLTLIDVAAVGRWPSGKDWFEEACTQKRLADAARAELAALQTTIANREAILDRIEAVCESTLIDMQGRRTALIEWRTVRAALIDAVSKALVASNITIFVLNDETDPPWQDPAYRNAAEIAVDAVARELG